VRFARIRTSDGKAVHAVIEGGKAQPIAGDIFGKWKRAGRALPLQKVKLLAPIVPVDLLCFGSNYKAHAEESGGDLPKAPIVFLKATSSVTDTEAPIIIPPIAPSQVDYEAELAVIIGARARNVSREDALKYVFGYTCANDVSARDAQHADSQWARGKSFDTFCPLGPWIETELNPRNQRIQGRLNGRIMQDATLSLLIFDVAYLVSYLSQGMTLLPGAVLLTGTPSGCGFAQNPAVYMKPGDVFEVEIDGIGTLRNPVASA